MGHLFGPLAESKLAATVTSVTYRALVVNLHIFISF